MKRRGFGILLFTLFGLTQSAFADGYQPATCPRRDEAVETEAEMKYLMTKDIAGFCKDAFLHRTARANRISDEEYVGYKLQSNFQPILDAVARRAEDAWGESLLPLESNRKHLFDETVEDNHSGLIPPPRPRLPKRFERIEYLERYKPDPRYSATIAAIDNTKRLFLCSDITATHASACSDALSLALEEMTPQSTENYGLLLGLTPTFREILSNPGYQKGLNLAASKMVAYGKAGKVPDGANLFDDLKSSFIESGITERGAEEYTWNVLGAISVGGPNTAYRLPQSGLSYETYSVTSSLITISRVTPYLNGLSMTSGHPYSAPKEMATTCDYTKYYHFWMAAFLAREGAKLTSSPEGAAAAAFTTEKGYQLRESQHSDQGRSLITVTQETFSPMNNVIRLDLAFSAAGAQYGAHSVDPTKAKPSFDADEGIKAIINNSSVREKTLGDEAIKLFSDEAANFHAWEKTFAPSSAFDYYGEQYR